MRKSNSGAQKSRQISSEKYSIRPAGLALMKFLINMPEFPPSTFPTTEKLIEKGISKFLKLVNFEIQLIIRKFEKRISF